MATRIKFYFDEHISKAVAKGLQRGGVDALTAHAAGRRGFSDAEQLAFALRQQRVMVTMDSDYIALAAQGTLHAGIAYAQPNSRSIGELIQALMLIYETLEPADMENHIEYL